MTIIWKIINWMVVAMQATICGLGTFYKHISFGWGLGDTLWYLLMYGLFIMHLIISVKSRSNKELKRHIFLTIIFLTTTIYICLKATIWRGVEYRWNGELFYH